MQQAYPMAKQTSRGTYRGKNNMSAMNFTKDVDYYNKEKIKRKQRDNKDIAMSSSLSLGLVAYAPQVSPEDLSSSQGEAEPDFSHLEYQAPTSPADLIKPLHIKRAIVQYYNNEGAQKLQKKKIKVRLNCDFGDGEEAVEFIAALTQDLGNFKKYHPAESRDSILSWNDRGRREIKEDFDQKAYMGKFHNNNGWRQQGSQVNQLEPWTSCLFWYNPQTRTYWTWLKIYEWEEVIELSSDGLTISQVKTNCKAQKLWYNPLHLNLQRPQTWAQKRFGK